MDKYDFYTSQESRDFSRGRFKNYAIREMQGKLDSLGCNYQRNGLGAIESFQKEIIIELLKEWRKRYE